MNSGNMTTFCLHCDYGHKKASCASEALVRTGFLSERQGKKFCVCYRFNHDVQRARDELPEYRKFSK